MDVIYKNQILLRLSIISINLNNACGLLKTIKSVINQTFDDFEYILLDGGSVDKSIQIIQEYADRISFWISEQDKGIYNAMNKGILKATGDYLLFLNSGDVLIDDNVLKSVFDLRLNEDILYGDLVISDGVKSNVHTFPDELSYQYFISNTIGHPSSFIKRDLFRKIGFYNEDLKFVSDWDFFLKSIIIYKVSYKHIRIPISIFLLDGCSSLNSNSEKIRNEREYVLVNLFPRFNVDYHHHPHLYSSKAASLYNLLSNNQSIYFLMKVFIKILVYCRKVIKGIIYSIVFYYRRTLELMIPSKFRSMNSIPVIINSYNRLEYLRKLVSWLEENNFTNIYIIDNNSTYPPLIDYYNNEYKHNIFKLKENKGHLALWNTKIYKRFINDYYIYTDSDILPIDECPENFLIYFKKQLKKYPRISKIGFSLKIDDLPDHYSKKKEVIEWEQVNYKNEIEVGLFFASIDTTFALYRPREKGDWRINALRTGYPYQARHLPWYVDDSFLSKEDVFYRDSKLKDVGHWS
jgi:glycosyltransferase involved in cell wall biosynthesis